MLHFISKKKFYALPKVVGALSGGILRRLTKATVHF